MRLDAPCSQLYTYSPASIDSGISIATDFGGTKENEDPSGPIEKREHESILDEFSGAESKLYFLVRYRQSATV
jgi:hypothetical protein